MPISAAAFVGGQIAGSALSSAANVAMAERQMRFQRKMSGTAHQREVRDLKRAGLNPILSAIKGGPGAVTPQGAMARVEDPTRGLPEVAVKHGIGKQTIATARSQEALNSASTVKMLADTDISKKQLQVQDAVIKREIQQANLNSAQSANVRNLTPKGKIIGQTYQTIGDLVIPAIKETGTKAKSILQNLKRGKQKNKRAKQEVQDKINKLRNRKRRQ